MVANDTGVAFFLGNESGGLTAQASPCRGGSCATRSMPTGLLLATLDLDGLDDVITTRVLVASTQQSDLVEAWDVVRGAFGDHDVPSTLLGVTVLGYDDQLVEIEAVAAVVD